MCICRVAPAFEAFHHRLRVLAGCERGLYTPPTLTSEDGAREADNSKLSANVDYKASEFITTSKVKNADLPRNETWVKRKLI